MNKDFLGAFLALFLMLFGFPQNQNSDVQIKIQTILEERYMALAIAITPEELLHFPIEKMLVNLYNHSQTTPTLEPGTDLDNVPGELVIEFPLAADFEIPTAIELPSGAAFPGEFITPTTLHFVDAHNYSKENMATMQTGSEIFWDVNCDDENPYTGFWMLGQCVPGVISYASWRLPYPIHTIGVASHYAPGVMEIVLENRSISLDGYKGALVFLSCDHIGEPAWIKRPGLNWEGPYLVVDCVQPWHMYVNAAGNHLFIEISYERWNEWNASTGVQGIRVCMGGSGCSSAPVDYWSYWEKRITWQYPTSSKPLEPN